LWQTEKPAEREARRYHALPERPFTPLVHRERHRSSTAGAFLATIQLAS